MKHLTLTASALALCASGAMAQELNIYNWGNYTNPDLITKFEEETGIKVTITDYDSNDTALAKIKAGGHGFDVVVPSGTYIPIFVGEGLLMESKPNEMENFQYVDPQWIDVDIFGDGVRLWNELPIERYDHHGWVWTEFMAQTIYLKADDHSDSWYLNGIKLKKIDVPEPGTLGLIAMGLLGLGIARRIRPH